MSKLLTGIDVASNVVINAASGAAGGTAFIYCCKCNPLNDEEKSGILGVAAGTAIYTATSALLYGVKGLCYGIAYNSLMKKSEAIAEKQSKTKKDKKKAAKNK